jgi:putative flavoprotein involved in K+ transport
VVGVENGKPVLADGRVVDVANVIWCTGFRNDYGWLGFPVPTEDDGYPAQKRGAVPSSPGLYFVGMPFLHSFSSMLILGAGRDAKRVVKDIVSRRSTGRATERLPQLTEEVAA